MDSLEGFIQLMIALSIASERLVEIVKGSWPFLSNTNTNAKKEGWRRAILHVLGVVSGIVTALLAQQWVGDAFPEGWNTSFVLIVIGLLISGGSGFWNVILSYLLQVKNLKKKDALK